MGPKKNVIKEIKQIICGNCPALVSECKLCLKGNQIVKINNLLFDIVTSERNRIKEGIIGLNINKVLEDMTKDKSRQELLKEVLIWVVNGKPMLSRKNNDKDTATSSRNKKET